MSVHRISTEVMELPAFPALMIAQAVQTLNFELKEDGSCGDSCGDGFGIFSGAECDDGNLLDGDGCSSDCK